MKYFTPEFLNFFKELAANNNREWFLENKKWYEKEVKKPMEIFVGDLIQVLGKDDKKILEIKPSSAIFRINKDIRFSKDKSPYKLHTSAAISKEGKKSESATGIYVELGPEKVAIAGGIYMPQKEVLYRIREAIAKKPASLNHGLNDKLFKKYWGDLKGERNKILPPEFKAAAVNSPYLYNKQFYFWVELNAKLAVSDKLLSTVMDHYFAAKPVSAFLEKAAQQ